MSCPNSSLGVLCNSREAAHEAVQVARCVRSAHCTSTAVCIGHYSSSDAALAPGHTEFKVKTGETKSTLIHRGGPRAIQPLDCTVELQ